MIFVWQYFIFSCFLQFFLASLIIFFFESLLHVNIILSDTCKLYMEQIIILNFVNFVWVQIFFCFIDSYKKLFYFCFCTVWKTNIYEINIFFSSEFPICIHYYRLQFIDCNIFHPRGLKWGWGNFRNFCE
jgi:hypothetical protein